MLPNVPAENVECHSRGTDWCQNSAWLQSGTATYIVIPAQAGIHGWGGVAAHCPAPPRLDSRFRGNDDSGRGAISNPSRVYHSLFLGMTVQGGRADSQRSPSSPRAVPPRMASSSDAGQGRARRAASTARLASRTWGSSVP